MEYTKPSKESLRSSLQNQLKKHLLPNSRIAIALSGGMDSIVLLHVASHLKTDYAISACHVNHGISPYAHQWQQFCQTICKQLNIELNVHCNPNSNLQKNISEAQARTIRLEAFAKLKVDAIIVAHHADDQAESVLFRLVRGTGVKGAAAIQKKSNINNKILLRPWLNIEKKAIINYARDNRLQWVEDDDNININRRRNFIRHLILPTLEQSIPNCKKNLQLSQANFSEADTLLMQLANIDETQALSKSDNGLAIDYFKTVGQSRARNWLYQQLSKHHLRFTQSHLTEIIRQLFETSNKHYIQFNFETKTLYCWQGHLYWEQSARQPSTQHLVLEPSQIANQQTLSIPNWQLHFTQQKGSGLIILKCDQPLTLRFNHNNEIMQLPNQPHKTASKLRQEIKMLPWRRATLPYFYNGDKLISVDGKRFCQSVAASAQEDGIAIDHWQWQPSC